MFAIALLASVTVITATVLVMIPFIIRERRVIIRVGGIEVEGNNTDEVLTVLRLARESIEVLRQSQPVVTGWAGTARE